LSTSRRHAASGPNEIKWDGYRTQIILQNGVAQAFTRRGHDWTTRYALIAAEALQLPCKTAIIDGEVILASMAGAADFAGLQLVIARQPERLTFVVFDLRIPPLSAALPERRRLLKLCA
jgi:bifunctional non-homologous end joining protein LigD